MQPEYAPGVYGDDALVEFSAELVPPCLLQTGWISISGNGQFCEFRWMSSEHGDGESLAVGVSGGIWLPHDHDRSICLAQGCAADVNGDGTVDVLDLLGVIAGWGECAEPCPPSCVEDVNADCVVNVLDLLTVIAAWGPCSV